MAKSWEIAPNFPSALFETAAGTTGTACKGVCCEMSADFCTARLFAYEKRNLISALLRDIDSERSKAALSPEWAGFHLRNALSSVRLLEAFGLREEDASNYGRNILLMENASECCFTS
jgi:hypothetical protein